VPSRKLSQRSSYSELDNNWYKLSGQLVRVKRHYPLTLRSIRCDNGLVLYNVAKTDGDYGFELVPTFWQKALYLFRRIRFPKTAILPTEALLFLER